MDGSSDVYEAVFRVLAISDCVYNTRYLGLHRFFVYTWFIRKFLETSGDLGYLGNFIFLHQSAVTLSSEIICRCFIQFL